MTYKLTSAKTEWTWNTTYQKMSDKAKAVIKEDVCMKFYDETRPLYIETDVSEIGLGAAFLQTRSNTSCHRDKVPDNSPILSAIAFSSKTLPGAKKGHSNTEREALDILYGLEKFHHYCFTREVSINTNYLLSSSKRM